MFKFACKADFFHNEIIFSCSDLDSGSLTDRFVFYTKGKKSDKKKYGRGIQKLKELEYTPVGTHNLPSVRIFL